MKHFIIALLSLLFVANTASAQDLDTIINKFKDCQGVKYMAFNRDMISQGQQAYNNQTVTDSSETFQAEATDKLADTQKENPDKDEELDIDSLAILYITETAGETLHNDFKVTCKNIGKAGYETLVKYKDGDKKVEIYFKRGKEEEPNEYVVVAFNLKETSCLVYLKGRIELDQIKGLFNFDI